MSQVTNVVLMASLQDPATGAVNRWLEAQEHPPLLEVTDQWRGRKAFECEVWIGAFNYLHIAEFINMCKVLHWEPKAQVVVCDQEGQISSLALW